MERSGCRCIRLDIRELEVGGGHMIMYKERIHCGKSGRDFKMRDIARGPASQPASINLSQQESFVVRV